MPRSAQTTDNEDQLEDLVGSPNLMMPITTTHLEDDESEDGELGERKASDVLRSTAVAATASELETWGLSLIHNSEPTRQAEISYGGICF